MNVRRALPWILCAVLAAAAGGLAVWFAVRTGEPSPAELPALKEALAQAKTRQDTLRVELVASTLQVLMRGVHARDEKRIADARRELGALGPETAPALKDLALRTASDPLKRELIAVLGGFKEPAASEALAEIYAGQSHDRRAVKEAAARALGQLAHAPAAAALGRLVRLEKDPAFQAVLARFYAPLAALDPQGVAPDPRVREARDVAAQQSATSADIHRLDPASDADFARLRELSAAPELSPAHRVSALRKIAARGDAAAAEALSAAARAPGKDPDGLVRANALTHLFTLSDPYGVAAVRAILLGKDEALRKSALLVARGSAGAAHRADLEKVRDGEFPAEQRELAVRAIERLVGR